MNPKGTKSQRQSPQTIRNYELSGSFFRVIGNWYSAEPARVNPARSGYPLVCSGPASLYQYGCGGFSCRLLALRLHRLAGPAHIAAIPLGHAAAFLPIKLCSRFMYVIN